MRLVQETQQGCFVLSFSERGDQLSQWRAYCQGGSGYAFGFDQSNDLFVSAKHHAFNLVRCEYRPLKQRQLCSYLVESFMEGRVKNWVSEEDLRIRTENFFTRYQWNLALTLAMSALKHEGFQEEQEWRLVSQYPEDALYGVSFRSGRFGITPYFTLPLLPTGGRRLHGSEGKVVSVDEIKIGPTPNGSASRSALELMLSKHNVTCNSVQLSQTPLRQ